MRSSLIVIAAACSLCACGPVQNPFAAKAAKPAAASESALTVQAAAPAAEPAPAATAAPGVETAAAGPANIAPPPAATAPPAVDTVRWSRADYAKREARLAALIANAETRDTSGETQSRAEEGRYRRAHCATRACIEQSYAAEEAWLKQWEGS